MRAFAQYRSLLIENKDLRKEIKSLDEKLNQIFRFLLQKIDELGKRDLSPDRPKIGYKRKDEN